MPLVSATTLARGLGLSIKSACALLDDLTHRGVTVEVTGRGARRLFGLTGLAPLADAAVPPRRLQLSRARGRPRHISVEVETASPAIPIAPFEPTTRMTLDYSDLKAALQQAEAAMRGSRGTLDQLAGGWVSQPDIQDADLLAEGGDAT